MKYRAIVADPPWPYGDDRSMRHPDRAFLPYPTMSVEAIASLPVRDLALTDPHSGTTRKSLRAAGNEPPKNLGSHLYLWTTTRFLCEAHDVSRAWGFTPSVILVWCKTPTVAMGGTYPANVEFVIVGRRGAPMPATASTQTRWFTWPRGEHSAKPDAFYDLVEHVHPGPYLELFARRNRLGWDTWGNEALEHVEIVA